MFPHITGTKTDTCLNYLPIMYPLLTDPLRKEGNDGVGSVIEIMNSYSLTRDDWENICELVKRDFKDIPSTVRSYFTKKANKLKRGTFSKKKKKEDSAPVFDEEESRLVDGDVEEEEEKEDKDDFKGGLIKKIVKKPKAKNPPKKNPPKKNPTKKKPPNKK